MPLPLLDTDTSIVRKEDEEEEKEQTPDGKGEEEDHARVTEEMEMVGKTRFRKVSKKQWEKTEETRVLVQK